MADNGDSTEVKLARYERSLSSTQNQLTEFQGETRENITALFNKIDSLVDSINKGRTTDWNQIAVMLTVVSMLGVLLLVGFVQPLQRDADRARDARNNLGVENFEQFKADAELDKRVAIQENEIKWILKTRGVDAAK